MKKKTLTERLEDINQEINYCQEMLRRSKSLEVSDFYNKCLAKFKEKRLELIANIEKN